MTLLPPLLETSLEALAKHFTLLKSDLENIETIDCFFRKNINRSYTALKDFLLKEDCHQAILKLSDDYGLIYYITKLDTGYLVIGPFRHFDLTISLVNDLLRKTNLPNETFTEVYTFLSQLAFSNHLMDFEQLLITLLRHFFNFESYIKLPASPLVENFESILAEQSHFGHAYLSHENIMKRYEMEKLIMVAISCGETLEAQKLYREKRERQDILLRLGQSAHFSKARFFVFNTICRLAAKEGGVSPVLLDQHAHHFTNKINSLTDQTMLDRLPYDMIATYCALVNENAIGHYSQLIQKTIFLIKEGYSNPLSLSIIAKELNVSKQYLSNRFTKETHQTLTHYIQHYRLQQASSLLAETDKTIQDISEAVGFSDVNYFIKLFKDCKQLTPSQFRKGKKK